KPSKPERYFVVHVLGRRAVRVHAEGSLASSVVVEVRDDRLLAAAADGDVHLFEEVCFVVHVPGDAPVWSRLGGHSVQSVVGYARLERLVQKLTGGRHENGPRSIVIFGRAPIGILRVVFGKT